VSGGLEKVMMKNKHIHIRPLNVKDAEDSLKFQLDNRELFERFSMTRSSDFYTIEVQTERIRKYADHMSRDEEYNLGIFTNDTDTLIGSISLFQVLRGDLQSAFIGYFLDKNNNGKGYTTEAVKLMVEYAFNTIKLHRIEAGVMPHNIASIRVLEKAGFHKEGLAKKNVMINGKWEDHQVLAIINPDD
jgi:[ribosomal protein S5]-alanine N-acetyltransferase